MSMLRVINICEDKAVLTVYLKLWNTIFALKEAIGIDKVMLN